jgi:broad specificity phosphatase PhoE
LHTAKLVSGYMNKEIHTDSLLKEINCGEYEGRLIDSIDKEKLRKLRVDPSEKYPGGESVEDVRLRGEHFLKKIKTTNEESILIFSHGNFLRAFASIATGSPASMAMKIYLENTGFNYLFRSGESFRISVWNATPHLFPFPKRIQI